MFNEKLAKRILERLDQEFPTTMTVPQLGAALGEFSNLSREDWFAAVDALQMQGFVGCKILRSGTGQVDDIGPIIITNQGRRDLHAAPGTSKSGVFISHIVDEKTAAQVLKEFLRTTFGQDLKVFVSSDYESIQSGKDWFNEIVGALTSAQVVLVLLSELCLDKRWINFEAGVGVGAGAIVVPVVYRGLGKGGIGPPLAALQARSLDDSEDVRALVNDLGQACRLEVKSLDADRVVSDLRRVERELPVRRALLTLYVIRPSAYGSSNTLSLRFRLENTGNRDIELIMVEASVPKRYIDPSWVIECDPNVIEVKDEVIGSEPYRTLRFKVFDGPIHSGFGAVERLPRTLAAGMPTHELKPPFGFALLPDLKEADSVDVPIFYATYAKGMPPEKGRTSYRELVMASYRR